MQAKELINDLVPPLTVSDSGLKAMNWMQEFKLEHLPLVNGLEYLGLVTEEDILKLNSLEQPLGNEPLHLIKSYVRPEQQIVDVVKLISRKKLSMVAVLDDRMHYMGAITLADIIKHYAETGIFEDAHGVIVLEMNPKNYSMAEIASIIESENGKILSAYITPVPESEDISLTLKINLTDLSRIISSFERHEYTVKEHYHHTEFMDDLKSRYDQLMSFLNI